MGGEVLWFMLFTILFLLCSPWRISKYLFHFYHNAQSRLLTLAYPTRVFPTRRAIQGFHWTSYHLTKHCAFRWILRENRASRDRRPRYGQAGSMITTSCAFLSAPPFTSLFSTPESSPRLLSSNLSLCTRIDVSIHPS